MKPKKLKDKRLKFAENVRRGMTLKDAALDAGYKGTDGYIRKKASTLRKEQDIEDYLEERAADDIITTDEILTGIRDIAVNVGERASDRLRAYELLGKNKALFTEKQDVTVTGDMGVRLILPEDDDSDG